MESLFQKQENGRLRRPFSCFWNTFCARADRQGD
jgi:hypothetical protein